MERKLEFYNLVTEYFQYFINKYGFHIVHQEFNPHLFGNAMVQLESATHRIRLFRDRGQVFLDIGLASTTSRQYDLAMLASFLDPKSTWSYKSPDETSIIYSSTEWKLCEVQRIFLLYHEILLSEDFFAKKNRRKLETFIKQRYGQPYLR